MNPPESVASGAFDRRPTTRDTSDSVVTMQRVAIVDPTESTRESLRTLLLGIDFVWLDNECARYEFFADVLQDSLPDLVIVALDADKNKALQLIAQVSAEHPELP